MLCPTTDRQRSHWATRSGLFWLGRVGTLSSNRRQRPTVCPTSSTFRRRSWRLLALTDIRVYPYFFHPTSKSWPARGVRRSAHGTRHGLLVASPHEATRLPALGVDALDRPTAAIYYLDGTGSWNRRWGLRTFAQLMGVDPTAIDAMTLDQFRAEGDAGRSWHLCRQRPAGPAAFAGITILPGRG